MSKVIAICGKICCGKSYYSNILKNKENAVILSCDEVTSVLFDNNLGEKHDEMVKRIWKFLLQKTVEIVKTNSNVILDWGFWSKEDRNFINNFFKENNVECEWHYIDIDDKSWKENIAERNNNILLGKCKSDYFLDDGLMKKLMSKWEEPNKEEIDVWVKFNR